MAFDDSPMTSSEPGSLPSFFISHGPIAVVLPKVCTKGLVASGPCSWKIATILVFTDIVFVGYS